MKKIEIYPIHNLGVLTTVECSDWWIVDTKNPTRLVIVKEQRTIAEFILNNIAGFKEVRE